MPFDQTLDDFQLYLLGINNSKYFSEEVKRLGQGTVAPYYYKGGQFRLGKTMEYVRENYFKKRFRPHRSIFLFNQLEFSSKDLISNYQETLKHRTKESSNVKVLFIKMFRKILDVLGYNEKKKTINIFAYIMKIIASPFESFYLSIFEPMVEPLLLKVYPRLKAYFLTRYNFIMYIYDKIYCFYKGSRPSFATFEIVKPVLKKDNYYNSMKNLQLSVENFGKFLDQVVAKFLFNTHRTIETNLLFKKRFVQFYGSYAWPSWPAWIYINPPVWWAWYCIAFIKFGLVSFM